MLGIETKVGAAVDAVSESLADYHLWHATRADVLRRLGRDSEAVASYRRAYELAGNEAERRFLAKRIGELNAALSTNAQGLRPR